MRNELSQLIEQLGTEEDLLKILEEFYKVLSDDILVGFFFSGKDLNLIAKNQKNFMLKFTGKRDRYEGKLPASAHLELPPILKGHFDRRLFLLKDLLKEKGLNDKQIQTWISFENQFRSVIEK